MAIWDFGRSTARQGFTSTGIVIFAGKVIQSFVREVIQNSIDEQVDKDKPVEVVFTIDDVSRADAPEFWELKPHLQLARDEEDRSAKSPSALEFYAKALNLVNAPSLRVFGIHDANTGGLGGVMVETPFQDVKGGWLSLVRSSGVSNKQNAGALGSFGQGSKAVFAFSDLRTVGYYTETMHDGSLQRRYQPKCYLQSMSARDDANPADTVGYLTSEVGFYQNDDTRPFLDNDIAAWPQRIRERAVHGTGTSIYVPAPKLPDDNDELWFYVKVETIANFYYAILKKHLTVVLDSGEALTAETVDDHFEELANDPRLKSLGDEVANKFESVRTIREGLKSSSTHGTLDTANFGPLNWFIRMGETVSKRKVGVARGLGMLITRDADGLRSFRDLKPFDYFVSVENPPGIEILRRLEPPEHDKFEFDRIEDAIERDRLKRRYKAFTDEVRDHIKTLAAYEVADEFDTDDMNDLLPGFFGTDAGEVDDETSIRIKIGRQRKRKAIEVGALEGGQQVEVPGVGRTGGKGKRKTKGGNNPGDGPGRAKANSTGPASQLRVVRKDPKDPTKATIFFTVAKSGNAFISLYKSGESEMQEIDVMYTSPEGLRTQLHKTKITKLVKGKRISLEVEIPVSDQEFAMTGVLNYVV